MNNFHLIVKQKCGSRSRKRGVNTHNKFQTRRTIITGVTNRIVSGTNKTKKKDFFFVDFFFEILVHSPP